MSYAQCLSSRTVKAARKDYDCDACNFIRDALGNGCRFTFSEMRAIVKAKHNNWKILKGESYINSAMLNDGDFYVFRSIPEIEQICQTYDLYDC